MSTFCFCETNSKLQRIFSTCAARHEEFMDFVHSLAEIIVSLMEVIADPSERFMNLRGVYGKIEMDQD